VVARKSSRKRGRKAVHNQDATVVISGASLTANVTASGDACAAVRGPKKRGRPRKDALANEAKQLIEKGLNRTQISDILNKEYRCKMTPDSIRKLVGLRTPRK